MSNCVLFLGAGFSKPFGFPVMRSFFQYVENCPRFSDAEKQELRKLRTHARKVSSMLAGPQDDLEHILSLQVMSAGATGLPNKGTDDRFRHLCEFLARVYAGPLDFQTCIPALRGAVKRLLSTYSNKKSLTLITTNYDVLCEYGFWLNQHPVSLALDDYSPMGGREGHLYRKNSTIRLCKLHGSVNWQCEERLQPIVVDDRLHECGVFEDDETRVFQVPQVNCDDLDYVPLIAPPTYFKLDPHPQMNSTWEYARRAIVNAEHIAFVGYSFPDSDVHMRYFLASAIYDNENCPTVSLVGPDASGISGRLVQQGSFGRHFLDGLRPVTKNWENLTLDELLAIP